MGIRGDVILNNKTKTTTCTHTPHPSDGKKYLDFDFGKHLGLVGDLYTSASSQHHCVFDVLSIRVFPENTNS